MTCPKRPIEVGLPTARISAVRSEAVRRFLAENGAGTDEKHRGDGVLASRKGLVCRQSSSDGATRPLNASSED